MIAYAERLPRSRGFHMHFVPASDEIYEDDIERSATSMNVDIERRVRDQSLLQTRDALAEQMDAVLDMLPGGAL